jgi:uncharacterized protein
MRIDVSELLKNIGAEAKVETELKLNYPDDGLVLTKPVKLKAKMVNTGEEILLTGKVSTVAKLECARCLKPCDVKITADLEERFRTDVGLRVAKDLELEEDDFVIPLEKGHFVPIDEVLRQVLIAAMPIKPLCNAKCEG